MSVQLLSWNVIVLAAPAPAYASLGQPTDLNALVAAVSWLEGTLLGSVATAAAVVVVARVGFGMLAGRVDWRRGATVVVGCVVLFSARSIGSALAGLASDVPSVEVEPRPVPAPAPPVATPPAPQAAYDPYAGASVPQ